MYDEEITTDCGEHESDTLSAYLRRRLCFAAIAAALTACSSVETPTDQPVRPPTAVVSVATGSPSVIATLLPLRTITTTFEQQPAKDLAVVDQSSKFDASRGGWWSIATLGPVGQTFVPTISGLDAVALWTEDQWRSECVGIGVALQVSIRERSIDGAIIGSSSIVTLPDCFTGATRFAFPSLIRLAPGKLYVIEVMVVSGHNWGVVWQQFPDPYPAGNSIVHGEVGDSDVWFQEGLAKSSPPTRAYCEDGLWQSLKRSNGSTFKDQNDCIQFAEAGK